MTRVELVDKLAFRVKITKKDADTYLTAFLDSIMDALVKDGRVVVQDFGSFKVSDMTNEPLCIAITLSVDQDRSRHYSLE